MNMSFLTYCALFMLPGWNEVMSLPVPERIAKLRDPETRAWMNERAQREEAGVFRRLADWKHYVLGDTYSDGERGPEGPHRRGRSRPSGGPRRSTRCSTSSSTTTCARSCGRSRPTATPRRGTLRKEVWEDPRAMLGGSDAGAHLDRMCGAPYTTRFLGDMINGRKLRPARARRCR